MTLGINPTVRADGAAILFSLLANLSALDSTANEADCAAAAGATATADAAAAETYAPLFPALPVLSPNSMALGVTPKVRDVNLSLLSLNDRVSDKGAAWAVGVGTTTGGDTLEGTAGEAFLWLRGGGSGWSAAATGGVLL
jgi:hypothetical protein